MISLYTFCCSLHWKPPDSTFGLLSISFPNSHSPSQEHMDESTGHDRIWHHECSSQRLRELTQIRVWSSEGLGPKLSSMLCQFQVPTMPVLLSPSMLLELASCITKNCDGHL